MSVMTQEALADWAGRQTWSRFAMSIADYFQKYGRMSDKQAEALRSMYAKALAKGVTTAQREPVANPVTEVGMYRKDNAIFRVKLSKQGRLYAMRFVPTAVAKADRFVYANGAIYNLSADDRMTVDEVTDLGLQFGICVVCGADLTDPKSVAQGIGPVCIKKV